MPVRANPTPKNTVHDLRIDEAALVDDGDNPRAHIRLFKSADDGKEMYGWQPRSPSERLAQRKFMEQFYEVRCAYIDSVNDVLYGVPADEMGKMLAEFTTDFENQVQTLLDGVAKAAPSLAKAGRLLVDRAVEAAKTHDPDAITKALEAFGAAPQDNQEDRMPVVNTPATKATPTSIKSFEDVIAALPADQRALVKAQLDAATVTAAATADAKAAKDAADAQLKAAEERTKALEVEVAKMKDEKLTSEMKAKAEAIGAGDVASITTLLKGAYGRSKEEGEALEKELKALGAQARAGTKPLLKVVGSESGTGAGVSDADPLDAKAREIAAAEKVPFAVAYARAAERFPDLAAQTVNNEAKARPSIG